MNHFQLTRLLEEITPRILGGFVRKIYRPERFCLQVSIYAGGAGQWLTVRTGPGLGCLYLGAERVSPGWEGADDFHLKLRSALSGLCLTAINQEKHERIVRLVFSPAAGGPDTVYNFVLELFPVAGNCFLLDSADKVLYVMHAAAARGRKNRPGSVYHPPRPVERPLREDAEDPLLKLVEDLSAPDYNAAAALHCEDLARSQRLEAERSRLRRMVADERRKLQRAAAHQQRTLDEAGRAEWYRECGEILGANFRSLRRGLEKIRLPDLFAPDSLTLREIPLDPALAPDRNLERYFRKYKKLKSGAEFAAARLEESGRRLARLDELDRALAGASTLSELQGPAAALAGSPSAAGQPSGKESAGKRLPYRRFTSADGSEILVGRGGKDNDELTFRVARGRDLWLHVSGTAGAHVVLTCRQEGDFSEQALLDAAHLAVFYSGLKKEASADVDYTYRKYLKRPAGEAPGKAIMAQRKTIHLRIEQQRLQRLLGKDLPGTG
ncbi:MAG: DUF814 domain-containing protein [Candidatus Glassbacteria bacterium]|nr:DUF814 domain-containing protein [Candidatus Glassbacteria bacterium]